MILPLLEKDIDCIKSSSNKLSRGIAVVMGENCSSGSSIDLPVLVGILELPFFVFHRFRDPAEEDPKLSSFIKLGDFSDAGDCTSLN